MSSRMAKLHEAISLLDPTEINRAIWILAKARQEGRFVWLAGNGGSAATTSHFANDLLKLCNLRAGDLSGMTPTTLAYGNDDGWERMFANPVRRLVSPGDVVVAISCSGNSQNILDLVEAVPECNVIILTGETGGKLAKLRSAACIFAMSDDITIQEDLHLIVCHEIATRLREA